jgi:hypothetical protein
MRVFVTKARRSNRKRAGLQVSSISPRKPSAVKVVNSIQTAIVNGLTIDLGRGTPQQRTAPPSV